MRLAHGWLWWCVGACAVVAQDSSTSSSSSSSGASRTSTRSSSASYNQTLGGNVTVSGNATASSSRNGTNATATSTPLPPLPPGFVDPLESPGADMLGHFDIKNPVGEPLNVIVSSESSSDMLQPEGFLVWATALGFGVSCLGQGDDEGFMYANLGRENPYVRQGSMSGNNGVLRWNYGLPSVGTCRETIEGGNHFRWFTQHTRKAGTAIFLAASLEQGLSKAHSVASNGYNLGRDNVVELATQSGGIEWEGNRFNATVRWIEAGRLLNAMSHNINHPDVAPPNGTAIDGRVAVLYVHTIQRNYGDESVVSRATTAEIAFQARLALAVAMMAIGWTL